MKNILKIVGAAMAVLALSACGKMVEVGAGEVAKITGKDGYRDGVIVTSKFRLDPCMRYCDNLVILDASDNFHSMDMTVLMPQDRLELDFTVRLTLAVNPDKYDELFSRMRTQPSDRGERIRHISLRQAFATYAEQIINTTSRAYVSQYTIMEIAANRDAVSAGLAERLTRELNKQTPFTVRHAALSDVKFPEIITNAQIRAAERREAIAQEEAELEVSKVKLERELQEERLQRLIDVERAEAEAQVNLILAESMTPAYERYRELQFLDFAAQSGNKIFIPVGMLDSVAGQVQLGNQ